MTPSLSSGGGKEADGVVGYVMHVFICRTSLRKIL